jgi:hypothetical protein
MHNIMNVIIYDTIEEVVIPINFLCLSLSSLRLSLLKCTPTISRTGPPEGWIHCQQCCITARSTNGLLKVVWWSAVDY